MDEFSKVLEVVTRVMREGAATHPDNEWTRLGPEYHVIRAERNLSSLREGADHVSHACTPGVDVESDRLMIGKVMKCGRCGQWIPLAQWKYAARRLVHDNCAAVSATQSSRGVTATAIAKVVLKSPAANALSCRHSPICPNWAHSIVNRLPPWLGGAA